MSLIRDIRGWLGSLPYEEPIQRRIAPILQTIFLGLILISIIGVALIVPLFGVRALIPSSVLPNLSFAVYMAGGLVVLRRGHFNTAVWMLIVFLLIGQAMIYGVIGFRNSPETRMLSVITLTLAALVLNRRALIITFALTILMSAVINYTQPAPEPYQLHLAFLSSLLLLALLTFIVDRFGQAFRGALADACEREKQLEAEIEARRQTENSLDAQREQYRVTLSSIGDAVIATDTAGRVTFINESAESLTGWTRADAIGELITTVFPIVNESTMQPVEDPVRRVLDEGIVVGLANHTALIARDKSVIPIADSGAPIRSADGTLIGAILVFRDVTEERRSQATLKESEERFRAMSNTAPVLIWMDDTNAERQFVNRQWLDFTGRQVEQEFGDGWLDGVHPDDFDQLWEHYTTAFENREPFSLEFRLRRQDGVYCWVLVNGAPRLLEDGTFAGYIGSVVDISSRVEAEERAHLLQSLTEQLSSTLAIDEIADVFTDPKLSLLAGQIGVIGGVNEDGDLDILNDAEDDGKGLAYEFASALAADAVQSQKPSWVENSRAYPAWEDRAEESGIQSAAALPLISNRRLLGAVAFCFPERQLWDAERQAFFRAVAQQYAQAVERARLHRQAQHTAAVAERQRLARELHDAVSQTLFSATTLAEGLPGAWERDPQRGRAVLNEVITLNRAAMAEMRSLLLELRPEAILRSPISTLLRQLVEAAKGRKGIEGEITIEGDEHSLNTTLHLVIYRIAQESINNILRHSQAKTFSLRLTLGSDEICLEIIDTGVGFDTENTSAGLGLNNIQERTESSGGSVDVVSSIEGGTRITARWMR